jgi:predicted unusual protein kinase regulating ubiquinone biosynthesis (AarF/ABC1/UbiB family)
MNFRFALRARRRKATAAGEPVAAYDPDVVRPMPRRRIAHSIDTLHVTLPRARRVYFEPGILLPIGRLGLWLWAIIQFYAGNLLDVLQRRASVERRAVRLRTVFEHLGGSFLKLAQQLSIRVDMLPYAYCAELSKMLDRVPPFPTAEAIAIIERNLGRPLGEVFAVFDPEPIGSASLACVYQAHLRTGERVAVKVRRPGIGPLIAADLRALDWLLIVAETLTIIPPDVGRRFTEDFRTILFNELNFRAEARYTDLFRRRALKRKKDVTAPRVYFQYCTQEVMVSEFVSGVWMWELLSAVDRNDQEFLSRVARIGIEPKALARKLVVIMLRESQEELFFHADPHPANLVIMPNNKVCFIDFGAIGRFSTATRKIFRELRYHMSRGDIGRIVNTALSLAGPLPPMDVDKVRNEMEKIYSDWVYAMASKDAEWWEKSTGQAWLRFLEVARNYQLPASYESIQYFRTSFSYDSIITRLNRDINIVKEFEIYAREAGKEARERVRKSLRQRLRGPTDLDYLQMEEFADMVTQFFFQVQRNVETPIIHFKNIVGKIAYIASLVMKLGYIAAAALGIGLIADAVAKRWFNYQIDWDAIIGRATTFGWVQLALIAVLLVLIRRIVIRLNMPDTRLDRDR